MKLTKILATALVSLFAMSAAVSAAEPACVMDFTDPDYTAAWVAVGGNNVTTSYDETEKAFRMDATGGDPYTQAYPLTADEVFDTGANTWLKICYKTTGDEVAQSQFHWGNDNYGGPHGDTNFNWQREGGADEWYTQIVEIIPTGTGDNTTAWTTNLKCLRIDPFYQETEAGRTMWVKYMAFFATEADAQAWEFGAAAAPEAPATGETTTTPEAGAAQTADTFSVAIAALACAACAGAVLCSKKR